MVYASYHLQVRIFANPTWAFGATSVNARQLSTLDPLESLLKHYIVLQVQFLIGCIIVCKPSNAPYSSRKWVDRVFGIFDSHHRVLDGRKSFSSWIQDILSTKSIHEGLRSPRLTDMKFVEVSNCTKKLSGLFLVPFYWYGMRRTEEYHYLEWQELCMLREPHLCDFVC